MLHSFPVPLLQLMSDEPGFFPYPSTPSFSDPEPDGPRKLGDYSYFTVRAPPLAVTPLLACLSEPCCPCMLLPLLLLLIVLLVPLTS